MYLHTRFDQLHTQQSYRTEYSNKTKPKLSKKKEKVANVNITYKMQCFHLMFSSKPRVFFLSYYTTTSCSMYVCICVYVSMYVNSYRAKETTQSCLNFVV